MSRSPSPDRQGRDSSPRRGSDEPAAAAAAAPIVTGQRPRLHMSGLPSQWNSAAAQEHFTRFGAIVDCVVFKDPATGRARYGFLEFERMESAQDALDAWNGKPLDDAPCMNLGFAKPKNAPGAAGGRGGDAIQPARLFVANIGSGTTAEQVRSEFEKFGPLMECSVWPNAKAHPRSNGERALSAFVQFQRAADARSARDALHLRPLLRGTEPEIASSEGPDFKPTPPLICDWARPKPGTEGGRQPYGGGGGGNSYGGPSGGGGGRDDRRYGGRDDYDRRDDYRRDERRRSRSPRRYDDRDSRSSSRRDDRDYGRDRDYRSSSRRSRSRSPRRRDDRERERERSPRRDRR